MSRLKLAAIGAAAMVVLVAGSVFAVAQPRPATGPAHAESSHGAAEPDAPPTAEELAHAVDRLAAHDISTDADTLAALAADHGLGGAIRLLAWASESGVSVDEIAALRAEGKGWGVIAKELGTHPGNGRIMGNGGGHGRDNAPGQQKQQDGGG